jgi:transcription-repair coupling factor (superfamily II helicase)
MEGPTKLKVMAPMTDRKERIKFVDQLLTQLSENTI